VHICGIDSGVGKERDVGKREKEEGKWVRRGECEICGCPK